MPDENKVKQFGNIVGGDQAGRDITHLHLELPERKSTLRALIEQYKIEKEKDIQFKETVENLEHYNKVVSPNNLIGLDAKLMAADRAYEIGGALRQKEVFVKKMLKDQFYKSAQEIFAYLLADIEVRYRRLIYPKIQQGVSNSEIDREVFESVLKPVLDQLDDNVLGINANCLEGMLYFLTGNCYLRWDRNADIPPSA